MNDKKLYDARISFSYPLYLDTNIIIAFYYPHDTGTQHDDANDFFKRMEKHNEKSDVKVELFCSHFTITEFVQSYITKPKIEDAETFRIVQELLMTNKIGKRYAFTLLNTKGANEDYSFEDFFLDVQTVLLNTKPRPGIADAIHATIMKNNHLKDILTFNVDDFKNIEGINAVPPSSKFI